MPKNEIADKVGEWHQRLQIAARRALSEDDVTEIIAGIVQDAKRGDRRARELVLKFLQLDSKPPALPAQQIRAETVKIYANGRPAKKRKLLTDQTAYVENGNGTHEG